MNFLFALMITNAMRFLPWPSSICLSVKRTESINANTKSNKTATTIFFCFSHSNNENNNNNNSKTTKTTNRFDNCYRTMTVHHIPYLRFFIRYFVLWKKSHCGFLDNRCHLNCERTDGISRSRFKVLKRGKYILQFREFLFRQKFGFSFFNKFYELFCNSLWFGWLWFWKLFL